MKKIFYLSGLAFILFTALHCGKESVSSNAGNTGTGGSMARFTIVGNYLYTVDNTTLKVFSITDPVNPILKKSVTVGFAIETIYPLADKLFLGSSTAVYIFSIADPEQPQQLSTAITPEVLRRCDPVVAKDTVAYATLRTNGPCGGTQSVLATYNIKDITKPVSVNVNMVQEPYGLGYADSALYVCQKSGLAIYNIQSAYTPVFRKSIDNGFYKDVIPYGNTLICWIEEGIVLYDITNRFSPQLIAKIN
ncbi:MAG: hypothetical protein QM731_21475 [Chitinophagaceae bacterium]